MGLFDRVKKAANLSAQAYEALTATDVITATDGSKIDPCTISTKYNLSKIKKDVNGFYIIGKEDIPKVIGDILYLNLYLAEAPRRHPCFP